jgi:hypothetical protein
MAPFFFPATQDGQVQSFPDFASAVQHWRGVQATGSETPLAVKGWNAVFQGQSRLPPGKAAHRSMVIGPHAQLPPEDGNCPVRLVDRLTS